MQHALGRIAGPARSHTPSSVGVRRCLMAGGPAVSAADTSAMHVSAKSKPVSVWTRHSISKKSAHDLRAFQLIVCFHQLQLIPRNSPPNTPKAGVALLPKAQTRSSVPAPTPWALDSHCPSTNPAHCRDLKCSCCAILCVNGTNLIQ